MENLAYKVKLDIFEGPLDLLLYLIRRDEVDITEISISRITGEYLKYIEAFKLLNIDLASEFISMAANLMYLKSRTLLPVHELTPDEEAEEDDPRWELIRQLIEYKKFKDAAGFLSHRELEQEKVFAHSAPPPENSPDPDPPELAEVSIFDLIQAFQRALGRFENESDFGDIVDDRFTVSDKIDFLLRSLPAGQSMNLQDLFAPATSKVEVIVTFLALLELMKMNQFTVTQKTLLGDIAVIRKPIR